MQASCPGSVTAVPVGCPAQPVHRQMAARFQTVRCRFRATHWSLCKSGVQLIRWHAKKNFEGGKGREITHDKMVVHIAMLAATYAIPTDSQ